MWKLQHPRNAMKMSVLEGNADFPDCTPDF
jgi:hypothetical protein